jgi:hypothetical protein
MKSPGDNYPHEGFPSPATPGHDVPKNTEYSSNLEELRQTPVVLNDKYVPAVETALETLEPGTYASEQLVDFVGQHYEGKTNRYSKAKILSAMRGNSRLMELKDGFYAEEAVVQDDPHVQADLLSTRVEHLLRCIRMVRSYNKHPKLGDCYNMARSLDITPHDPETAAYFEDLFTRHVQVRIDPESNMVSIADPKPVFETIGDALDVLAIQLTDVTYLTQEMLLQHLAPGRSVDSDTRQLLAATLELDEHFVLMGQNARHKALYKYMPEGGNDRWRIAQLDEDAQALIDLLQPGDKPRILSRENVAQYIEKPKYTPEQIAALWLLVDAHSQIQHVLTEDRQEFIRIMPAAQAKTDTSSETDSRYELELAREVQVEYDNWHDQRVARGIASLPPGMYGNDLLNRIIHLSYLSVTGPREQQRVLTSIMNQEAVLVLRNRAHVTGYYIKPEADETPSVLDKVERCIDQVAALLRSNYTMNLAQCYEFAVHMGLMPEGRREAAHFKFLFQGHPRVEVQGKHILQITESDPSRPSTVGEAVDRLVRVSHKQTPYSVGAFMDQAFDRQIVSKGTVVAFKAALERDPRFERMGPKSDTGSIYYQLVRAPIETSPIIEPSRAMVVPATAGRVFPRAVATSKSPLERQLSRRERLANIADRISTAISDAVITMPSGHILQIAARLSSLELTKADNEYILTHVDAHSRLRRLPHHPLGLFVEKATPAVYQHDQNAYHRPEGEERETPTPYYRPKDFPRPQNKGKIIDFNDVPAIEYERIRRIEQLLAMYEKQRVERIEMEQLAADRDAKKARQQRKKSDPDR